MKTAPCESEALFSLGTKHRKIAHAVSCRRLRGAEIGVRGQVTVQERDNRRTFARYRIEDPSGRGEIYDVTDAGYRLILIGLFMGLADHSEGTRRAALAARYQTRPGAPPKMPRVFNKPTHCGGIIP